MRFRQIVAAAFFIFAFLTHTAQAAPRHYKLRLLKNTSKQYSVTIHYPVLEGKGAVVRLANSTLARFARSERAHFLSEARKSLREFKPIAPFYYTMDAAPDAFQGPHLISVRCDHNQFMGGAHGMNWSSCYNFGLVKGRAQRINLGDFFPAGDKTYPSRVSKVLFAKLKKNEGAMWVHDGSVKTLTVDQLNHFVLEKDGLRYLFAPYEMGPYAYGAIEIKLTVADLGPTFRWPPHP